MTQKHTPTRKKENPIPESASRFVWQPGEAQVIGQEKGQVELNQIEDKLEEAE